MWLKRTPFVLAGLAVLVILVMAWQNIGGLVKASPEAKSVSDPSTSMANATAPTMQQQLMAMKAITQGSTLASAYERIEALESPSSLQQSILQDHKTFTRYPPQSRRIASVSQDPITSRYAVDERTTFNDDKTVGMSLWTNQKYYSELDQVQVFAKVVDDDDQRLAQTIKAQLVFNETTVLSEFVLEDDDQDGLYHYQFINEDVGANQVGVYKIRIQAIPSNLVDSAAYVLSRPGIALTGEFSDRIKGGHLAIGMQVQVEKGGRYYAQASLYDIGDSPIGTTQWSGDLNAGLNWIDVEFYGLMLHDSEQNGPYILKQVGLSRVTVPIQRAPLATPDYQTESYQLDEFSTAPYTQ